ncbi:MAG: hypothetical protein AABX77_02850 [Nanoarchaeota archaeon]
MTNSKKEARIVDKKGKIAVEFLIGVIILVIGFIVVLYFIFLVPYTGVIDKETCHQSIVYRATAKIKVIDISQSIPLKCQTEKICLTMSGEDCGLASNKKNPVKKIKLSKDKQEAREKIKEIFAGSMIACHSMLGEGQLNFLPHEYLKFEDTKYGLICTRLVFDKESKEQVESIGFGEFYSYLEKKTVDDKSYLDYLYPGVKDSKNFLLIYDTIKNKQLEEIENEKTENEKIPEFVDWKIDLKQENGYAIIASISTKSQGMALLEGLGVTGIISGGLIFTGFGAPLGAAIFGLGSGGAVFWYEFDENYYYFPPAIYPYDITRLQELGVHSFEIAP